MFTRESLPTGLLRLVSDLPNDSDSQDPTWT